MSRRAIVVVAIVAVTAFAAAVVASCDRNGYQASTAPSPHVSVTNLMMTDQKDGDSWVASDGREYRLGLVDTPEIGERCGPEAAKFTGEFIVDGFSADTYATDIHGRTVAEVFNLKGRSLNIALARSGLGNDRYLNQFRHENPDLARRLELAFAKAGRPDC
jgi:endonuclease YncB( thermonuclease family)